MKLLIIFLLIVILWVIHSCAKEYSCEKCYPYNDLITNCDIFIENNSEVSAIYPQVRTKINPGHYYIFETIKMDSTGSATYKRTYDLKDYLPMEKFYKGDSFFVRYEIRWKFTPAEFVKEDTLIY